MQCMDHAISVRYDSMELDFTATCNFTASVSNSVVVNSVTGVLPNCHI